MEAQQVSASQVGNTEEFGIFRKTKENKINRLKMGKVVHTNKSTMFLY